MTLRAFKGRCSRCGHDHGTPRLAAQVAPSEAGRVSLDEPMLISLFTTLVNVAYQHRAMPSDPAGAEAIVLETLKQVKKF